MLTSYHVHSTHSDGKSPIREFVEAAIEAGLDELGISDHYVLPPSGEPVVWSMPLAGLPAYFEDLRAAREFAGNKLTIRYGLEADFDPLAAEDLGEVLRAHELDYVIGAVHFLDGFPVDENAENWDELTQPERNDMVRFYWDRVGQAARSGLFDFFAHLDLCKKFGHLPTVDISGEVAAALDAIAEAGMGVEINTSGLYMPIAEAYPSRAILLECRRRGIPVQVNSDAHVPANLTRGFDDALRLIADAGYAETAVYSARKMSLVALPQGIRQPS